MLQQFYPDHEADSAYGIDYKTLYRKGYRGIIFDIDNALVPQGAPATPQAIEFFGRLRELGFIEQQGTQGEKLCGRGRGFLYL